MKLLTHSLKYEANPLSLFARFCHQPWAMLLDSGQPQAQYGRYDILVADPFITICTTETHTEVTQNGQKTVSREDPFVILNRLLAPYGQAAQSVAPFAGGAVGYWGYDLARHIENLPDIAEQDTAIPHLMVGIYDWAVVIDHREKTACLVSYGLQQTTRDNWDALCAQFDAPIMPPRPTDFALMSSVSSNMDFSRYAQAFDAVKRYIAAGDCYQVNLAQRFSARAQGDSWQLYQKLREISPAPFMAYMNFGAMQVLSGSPERFLQVVQGHVETRPIKGTRPRSANAEQDRQNAQELQTSLKDRAENLMIVDLLRNDISKNCATGSVKVKQLFQLQSFANVHHLVSIITAMLQKGKTAVDLLRGCFPGGSITGAPKLRAMHIIEELEPHRRGVYCGAIGYIGFDGNMDTNIAIRTAVYCETAAGEGEVSFYAGGGIVADSLLQKEYAETLDKASGLLQATRFFEKATREQ